MTLPQRLLACTAAVMLMLGMQGTGLAAAPEEFQSFVNEYANFVSSSLSAVNKQADSLSSDPALLDAIRSGDADQIRDTERKIRRQIQHALRVRLLPPGVPTLDLESDPPLSFACLDLIRQAATNDAAPPVEAHFNSKQKKWHIELARPLRDPAGKDLVGVLLISLDGSAVEGLLGTDAAGGLLQLRQEGGILQSVGDRALQGAAFASARVAGTRWMVTFVPAGSKLPAEGEAKAQARQVPADEGMPLLYMAAAGVVALLLLLLLVQQRRKRGKKPDTVLGQREGFVKEEAEPVLQVDEKAAALAPGATGALFGHASDGMEVLDIGAGETVVGKEGEAPPAMAATPTPPAEEGEITTEQEEYEKLGIELPSSIFRAYDIRGIVGETLTIDAVYQIGRAIGSEIAEQGERSVVVGRDGRLSGEEVSAALIRGLTATGIEVIDVGMVPTPLLYFAIQKLDTNSGVMVTGSHNPAEYNGLKIVINGKTLSDQEITALRTRIATGQVRIGMASVRKEDVKARYIEALQEDVILFRPFNVVVDCGNGVAGDVVPDCLRGIGCTVTELYCDVDGNFPNHHPDPSKPENLKDLIQAVRDNGADLGLAFDGDGDRLGVIDSDGKVIWPDRLLMVLAIDVLSRNPGAQVIFDVKCTANLAKVIEQHGGQPVMYRTGHSFIKKRLQEPKALLAGEMSGHLFIKERYYGYDDAIYGAARLMEAMANYKGKETTAAIFADLPDAVSTPELNVAMAREGENMEFIEMLKELGKFEGATLVTIDGIRAEFPDGWGLVRASNTTPVLVFRFEGDNDAAVKRIQKIFREQILILRSDLELPF
jgi:phosphomannomutase/phosphoglucomutase